MDVNGLTFGKEEPRYQLGFAAQGKVDIYLGLVYNK